MLVTSEAVEGLVLNLSPESLVADGAAVTCRRSFWPEHARPFLIFARSSKFAGLLPLYEHGGVGYSRVPSEGRKGAHNWTCRDCYFFSGQVWIAKLTCVVGASVAGRDLTQSGSRNWVLARCRPVALGDAWAQLAGRAVEGVGNGSVEDFIASGLRQLHLLAKAG
jgi:hypothetical protein